MVDSKCYDLAESFLKDRGYTYSVDTNTLAQEIQDVIDSYITDLDEKMDQANA